VTNAEFLASHNLNAGLMDCNLLPTNAAASVGKVIDTPPTKAFHQFYYLGMNSVASWAIVTSAGIIQIDSLDNPVSFLQTTAKLTTAQQLPKQSCWVDFIAHFRRLYCLKNFTIICEAPGG
jgi:hypothetical protein